MPQDTTGTRRSVVGKEAALDVQPALLDARTVAAMLSCSRRAIYTFSDGGRMPRPIKLGRLTRWRRVDIEKWIADRCPDCRNE